MALHMSLQLGGELRIKIADFTCCVLCSALLHIFGLRKGCFTDAASLVLLSDVIFQGKVASKGLFAKLTDSHFLLVFKSQILPLSPRCGQLLSAWPPSESSDCLLFENDFHIYHSNIRKAHCLPFGLL